MNNINKLKLVMVLALLTCNTLFGQTPSVLQTINYETQGDLIRFYGISLTYNNALNALDNQDRHAWEVDTILSCRISDIRLPPGTESYSLVEGESDSLLNECLSALNASNSRTHPPQFSNQHLSYPNITRFSLGNEPPIHVNDFAPYGGYVNWVVNMLQYADTTITYFQSAQAIKIINIDDLIPSQQVIQQATWDSAKIAWTNGDFACAGIATTEKCKNVNTRIINTLRADLDLYAQDFPDAKIWFTEWNPFQDSLAQGENDYLQLAVAEMLLSCARLYYERNGQLEALHYHQGWTQWSGGGLINLVSGQWILSKGSEVYRDFAPLFYGRWGDFTYLDTDTNLVMEAFITEDNRYAVAYVNKNYYNLTTSLGFTTNARSYGVIYYDSVTSVQSPELQKNCISLSQNFPNPFNAEAIISWQSETGGFAKIEIYDVIGRKVKTLVDSYMPSGRYEVNFNSGDMNSGVYYYQLQIGNYKTSKKMMILK